MKSDILKIADRKFKSRLIVGTGKYKTMKECAKAIKISGADVLRRCNLALLCCVSEPMHALVCFLFDVVLATFLCLAARG